MDRWFWIVSFVAILGSGTGMVLTECGGDPSAAFDRALLPEPEVVASHAPAPAAAAPLSGETAGQRPAPAGADAGPRATRTKPPDTPRLHALVTRLAPLFQRKGPVQPGDWLARHKEAGQTFSQYLEQSPVHARGKRRVLYIQPIGNFDTPDREVLRLTARFLAAFFCLPVRVMSELPLIVIPKEARRVHPFWGDRQILAPYVLEALLSPRLPPDAASLLALTPQDLWPGDGWNFVFGMASLYDRVGVWSTYRNGDPVKERRLHLRRTFKVASHETGHMLSIRHCTAHECGMCGSNNLGESDRQPMAYCPHCLAKLLWATGCDAAVRYRALASVCKEAGLKKEEARYRKLLAAVEGKTPTGAPARRGRRIAPR